ncbi:MAG: acyl-CoA thioesterase [Flavobacteriales bacterium]|jgi:acyl-CoA thioester hydrolase|nr:acyl-CoA thioesterase [Flavobacteriales bacterium]
MERFSTHFRVMYADTDQMQVMHHSAYVKYLEVARTELMRDAGLPYVEMESMGIMSPILDLYIKYLRPALYDRVLEVKTWISQVKGSRITFSYEIYEDQQLLTTAYTTLVFLDAKTKRPSAIQESFLEKIKNYIT